ncbi:MarR family winged helix-turn-helix transcriptional regulator [Litoribrevibacter euphylliae]|uniref:MarR family winged helix-turn-helix transcriptional regulator n=1 Tax=Litoribrevibacter euphylliae TaxID=1834034 RepID=A0ABV7HFD3_9GAMM
MANDKRIYFLLSQAQHKMSLQVDRALMQVSGISGPQAGALFYLEKHDGCQQKDMAKGLKLDTSAITGMVERLTKKGLIEKQRSELDKRAFTLHLTQEGRAALNKVQPMLDQFNQHMLDKFGKEKLEHFCEVLTELMSLGQKGCFLPANAENETSVPSE